MMHFMCFTDGAEINIIGATEKIKTLVDEDIVHQEICEPIDGDSESDVKAVIHTVSNTEKNQDHAGDGEDQEEGIVLFKESRFRLMMIFVEVPAESVHNVFMGKPGHILHEREGDENNGDIDQLR